MTDLLLLEMLGLMIVAAAAVVLLARVLRMPTIVAYILAGLVLGVIVPHIPLGPARAADIAYTQGINVIADLGVALLLFLVGLELSLHKVRDVGGVSLRVGLWQTAFTGIGGFALAWLLGFALLPAVLIAAALTNSSTVMVVKLLDQKREMDAVYGHIAVGANLVKDVVLIIVLTLVVGLTVDEDATAGDTAWKLAVALGGSALLLLGALAASRWVLSRPFAWVARNGQTLLIWALAWAFLFAVAAEFVGISAAIGAFLAGVSLAQLACADELRRRLHPLVSFFLAVFFIAVGMQMQIAPAIAHWPAVLALSVFVLVGNTIFCTWLIARRGYGERTAFLAGSAMGQISELSFVFVAVGLTAGVLSVAEVSVVTLVGLITIAISAYMILYNHQLYGLVRRLGLLRMFNARQADDEEHEPPLAGHVVVVGMNALGRAIATALHERGEAVLAIDTDPAKLAPLPCRRMTGDVDQPMVFEQARVAHARLAVSALQIEEVNNLLAYRCKRLGVPVAIHAFDRSVLADLRQLGVDHMIDSRTAGRAALSAKLVETGVIEP